MHEDGIQMTTKLIVICVMEPTMTTPDNLCVMKMFMLVRHVRDSLYVMEESPSLMTVHSSHLHRVFSIWK